MNKEEHLFKSYPTVDTFYKTSDGQYFIDKENAISHGNTRTDKKITEVTRASVSKAAKDAEDAAKKTAAEDAARKKAAEKKAAEAVAKKEAAENKSK